MLRSLVVLRWPEFNGNRSCILLVPRVSCGHVKHILSVVLLADVDVIDQLKQVIDQLKHVIDQLKHGMWSAETYN